jgi:transposase
VQHQYTTAHTKTYLIIKLHATSLFCVICLDLWVVLNYETKSKRNEQNETKRNEILRNATKYTKRRNETQRNETKFTIMRNEMK